MTGWLYRLIYRREIRERQERMSAFADVMRERQVEIDARWDRVTAELERAKRLPPDEFRQALVDAGRPHTGPVRPARAPRHLGRTR